ncbi:thymidine kinase [Flammeovirga yaeyamensis]|uniref:Thymidine kinase n=1 Tax=Flammeovirga yaeyamensis TaxID=367791 RepID=A0AAX1N9Y9_9BACT|nr:MULTISPECIES: thymidine kinase [Flammeovirga]ANQ49705.2 thymidine kinase [Flammeovirga sp. MY04]MBB3697430.1 thymidine kinase [Flammeovirga yaeyamensis]NMF36124.1 thymidine kinase [Flammeovirga yaeyamensis]QWG02857.1 thymidine kinase [Flammeovirga yaeyamensis]
MFVEPRFNDRSDEKAIGWIEVVCGSMFSGKTEELIRRVNRATIAKQTVHIFKPAVDTRYHEENVVSHNSNSIISTPVKTAGEITQYVGKNEVIAIDEAQFFDQTLVDVCVDLANKGHRIIVCGLDMDFQGNPFEPMPQLMAIAEYVTKLHAICVKCGEPALYSYRLSASKDQVLLGETDSYEARCRKCYQKGMSDRSSDS